MVVRRNKWLTLAVAAVTGLGVVGFKVSSSHAEDKPGSGDANGEAITAVMKKAFKGAKPGPGGAPGKGKPSLVAKVIDGSASADEIKSLVGYLEDLSKTTPPKGDKADWDDRNAKMLKAVKAIDGGDKTAAADLKTASNCKDCHSKHKED